MEKVAYQKIAQETISLTVKTPIFCSSDHAQMEDGERGPGQILFFPGKGEKKPAINLNLPGIDQ